jgi:hypothetical protein
VDDDLYLPPNPDRSWAFEQQEEEGMRPWKELFEWIERLLDEGKQFDKKT